MRASNKHLERLTALRNRFQRDLERLEEGAGKVQQELAGEASYDDRIAEIASLALGQELNLNLEEHIRLLLDRIDAAIRAIAEGTYGKCESCGGRIPDERLEIVPYADKCVECQRRLEGR